MEQLIQADNLASFKNIKNVSDISLVENQTITPPNSSTPESPVIFNIINICI